MVFSNQIPFRWGIIGPGRIAHKFAAALKSVSNAQIAAVGSREFERSKTFTQNFGGLPFGSYNQMLDQAKVDAIYVATPHTFHCEHSLMILERGIPVLCEKPISVNSGQLLSMI